MPYRKPARKNQEFWSLIQVGSISDCWEPKLSYNGKYPQVKCRSLNVRTSGHRIAFRLTEGYWPTICRHTCDNSHCWNPFHLEDGTQQDNINDAVSRDRNVKGEQVGNHKLTESEVLDIRARYLRGDIARVLAEEYGVTSTLIYMIRDRKVWKHI